MKKLTTKSYWEDTYKFRKFQHTLSVDGFANHSNRLILSKLLETDMENKRILEVGAGDSIWLPYLAKRFPSSQFVGIDYSEGGCALLSERTRMMDNVEVVHEDMLSENSQLHGSFDTTISFGVVEHFDRLDSVLRAKKRYLKPDGIMVAIIPNLAGILGSLTSVWNREVYDKHNPHDSASFLLGHQQAGLNVLTAGYIGSNNFGVLSACFPERKGLAWQMSRILIRLSLAIWWLEDKLGNLPTSKVFSPYIYAISQKPEGFDSIESTEGNPVGCGRVD